MAVKTKAQLAADIAALGSTYSEAAVEALLTDMVDSYNNLIAQVTTAQRNALTPTTGLVVYNTDTNRQEYWNGTAWFAVGQNISTPQTVKIDLTSAQILALHTTPTTVAAAPGVGYAIAPVGLVWKFTYGSVQYTDGGGSNDIALRASTASYANRCGGVPQASIKAAANSSGPVSILVGSGINAIVENDSFVLAANSAFSAGDGTLTVWVTYSVIEV